MGSECTHCVCLNLYGLEVPPSALQCPCSARVTLCKEQETTGEAPNVMRVPSPWVDDLELSGEDPFLGSGAFSTILRTTDRSTGQGYAVKVMSRDNFVLRGIGKQLDAEIECMRLSSKGTCENIVRMLDMTEDQHL